MPQIDKETSSERKEKMKFSKSLIEIRVEKQKLKEKKTA